MGGLPTFFGGEYPARIWTAFMTGAMQGMQVEDFPEPAYVGETRNPEPTFTPTPSPTTSTPTPTPTPTSLTTAPPSPTDTNTPGPPSTPPGQDTSSPSVSVSLAPSQEEGG